MYNEGYNGALGESVEVDATDSVIASELKDETEQMKAKYGTIYKLDLTLAPDDETEVDVSYVFKRPSTASYDRYVKTASSGATKALKTFLFDNIIPEHRAKLEKDLDEYPALTLSAGEKLLTMLGLSKNSNLVKL